MKGIAFELARYWTQGLWKRRGPEIEALVLDYLRSRLRHRPAGWLHSAPVACEQCAAVPESEHQYGVLVGWALNDWYTVQEVNGSSILLCGACWRDSVWGLHDDD